MEEGKLINVENDPLFDPSEWFMEKMRGFSYVTIDNGKLAQISSQDVEPHDKEALEIAEAAALTFIKK